MSGLDVFGPGSYYPPTRHAMEAWIGLWVFLLACLVLAVVILSHKEWRWFELAMSLAASIGSAVMALLLTFTCGSYAAGTWAELLRMLAFANFCSHHERDVLGWSILDPLPQDEDSLPPAAVGGQSQTYADPSWPMDKPKAFSLRRSDGSRVWRWKNIIRLCTMPIHVLLVFATIMMALSSNRSGTFGTPSTKFAGSEDGGTDGAFAHAIEYPVEVSKFLYLVATGLMALFDLALVIFVARCMVQHHRSRSQAKQPYALWLMVIASPFLLADAAWNIWAVVYTPRPNTIYALTWGNIPAWLVGALLIASAIPEKYQGSLGKGARDISTGTMQAWELDQEHGGLYGQDRTSTYSSHLSSHHRESTNLLQLQTTNPRGGDSGWHLGQSMRETEDREAGVPLSAHESLPTFDTRLDHSAYY